MKDIKNKTGILKISPKIVQISVPNNKTYNIINGVLYLNVSKVTAQKMTKALDKGSKK